MRFDRCFCLFSLLLLVGCTIQLPSNAPPVPPPPGPPAYEIDATPWAPEEKAIERAVSVYRSELAAAWREVAKAKPKTVGEASELARPMTEEARAHFVENIHYAMRPFLGDDALDEAKLASLERFAKGIERPHPAAGKAGPTHAMRALRRDRPPTPEDMPAFVGQMPDQRIDFDIVGEWKLLHFGTAEKPASKDGWKGQFTLERKPGEDFVWQGHDGAFGEWHLTTRPVRDGGQFLIWEQTWKSPIPRVYFAINEHRFGLLHLTDAETGERYVFMRTEGGQDAPQLVYPQSPNAAGSYEFFPEPTDANSCP